MTEKHREVTEWLENIFGDEPVPRYEVNSRTIEILHELMQKNQEQDKLAELLVEDYTQKEEEYTIEADREARILEKVGLLPDSLSQSGSASLRTLAATATLLNTRDASDTSLLLGLTKFNQEKQQVEDSRRREKKLSASLFTKTKDALLQSSSLKKALSSLEEQTEQQGPELEKKARQAGFLQSKAKEYRKQIHKHQLEFAKSGADPEIFHKTLEDKHKALEKSKEKLIALRAKLDSYNSLPPDIALAKVKVEEAKRELASLEEELGKHIDLMHT